MAAVEADLEVDGAIGRRGIVVRPLAQGRLTAWRITFDERLAQDRRVDVDAVECAQRAAVVDEAIAEHEDARTAVEGAAARREAARREA